MSGLTAKQVRFVEEYLIDLNATQAAIRAGYKVDSANVVGPRLLTHPRVQKAIEAGRKRQAAIAELSAVDLLRELARIAFCDISQAFDKQGNLLPLHSMPEDVRRCIAGIEVAEIREGQTTLGQLKKVKFLDKHAAIQTAMKHRGMLVERVKVGELNEMTDDQLKKRYDELMSKGATNATKPPESE